MNNLLDVLLRLQTTLLRFHRLLQVGAHLLQRTGKHAHFVLAGDVDPGVEISLAHIPGKTGALRQGITDQSGNKPKAGNRNHQDNNTDKSYPGKHLPYPTVQSLSLLSNHLIN